MVVDLSDKSQQQRRLASRQRRQQAATRQQRMAVDRGAFRVKSEEGLEVGTADDPTGSQVVYGILRIIGQLIGDGDINWEGDINQLGATNLRGPVAITGENGTLTVDAETLLQGLTTLLTDLIVQAPGRIILKGTTDAILENGEFTLANGAKLAVGLTGGTSSIGLIPEGGVVNISANALFAWLKAAGATMSVGTGTATIDAEIVRMPSIPQASTLDGLRWVAIDADDKLWRVPPGIGGPGTGDFDWPFALGMVTSEYGMRIHPITGVETMHYGIDFGASLGTPIKAAGAGTVSAVAFGSGPGNYVDLDHGSGIETRYFHMRELSTLTVGQSVAKGAEIGFVGDTGSSDGAHLHFETHVNGNPINPRDFMAAHNPDDGVA